MTVATTSITLSEWDTLGPDECSDLAGRFLDASHGTRQIVARLSESNLLALTELRRGLEIRAYSHVGRIRVGDLNVTVLPKVKGASLLALVRYAYGFRRLNLISDSLHLLDQCGLEDLLISQLNAEVQELIARGLLRAYIPTTEQLSSPRGRIDLMRLAMQGGTITATLPCHHHPRIEDTLLNRVLMAGLQFAGTIASIVELRRESRRLATLMEEQVSPLRLDGKTLERATRQMNRLTTAYAPALSIIRLLVEAQGVVLEGQSSATSLPGFLFDMNAFFQALMSRFLRDNLPGYSIRDEHGLKGMMRYNPKYNPKRRQSPTPRPDYVVTRQGAVCSILDAKYRDLWEQHLPREMLYQLVVYAISRQYRPHSSILYPAADKGAREARIEVSDPIHGRYLGEVCLRPVHLPTLAEMVAVTTAQGRRHREVYARRLAFGETV